MQPVDNLQPVDNFAPPGSCRLALRSCVWGSLSHLSPPHPNPLSLIRVRVGLHLARSRYPVALSLFTLVPLYSTSSPLFPFHKSLDRVFHSVSHGRSVVTSPPHGLAGFSLSQSTERFKRQKSKRTQHRDATAHPDPCSLLFLSDPSKYRGVSETKEKRARGA